MVGNQTPSHASSTQQALLFRVPIHCYGCARKIKKLIRRVDGVESVSIEPECQKVTVSGCVEVKAILERLHKAGKEAELWQQCQKNAVESVAKNTAKPKKEGDLKKKPDPAVDLQQRLGSIGGRLGMVSKKGSDKTAAVNGGDGDEDVLKGTVNGGDGDGNAPKGSGSGVVSKPFHDTNTASFLTVNKAIVHSIPQARTSVELPSSSSSFSSLFPSSSSSFSPDSYEYITYLFNDENANNCSIM